MLVDLRLHAVSHNLNGLRVCQLKLLVGVLKRQVILYWCLSVLPGGRLIDTCSRTIK